MTPVPLNSLAVVERPPDLPVAFRGSVVCDWQRFRSDVGAVSADLAGCSRVILACQDSYWFTVGLFGLLAAGATAVLPPNAQPGTLSALAADGGIVLLDTGCEPIQHRARHVGARHVGARHVGVGHDGARHEPSWTTMPQAAACRLEFYTSGCTGTPKRVARTLAELDGEVAMLDRRFGEMVAGAPVTATVPHQHVYGIVFKLLWPLATARPFAASQHQEWESLLVCPGASGVVISSPAHLSRLGGLAPRTALQRPRMVFSAGSALSIAASEQARTVFGIMPTEIYGSTETGAVAARQGGGSWQALPGNRVATKDGHLRTSLPHIAAGIWTALPDKAQLTDEGFQLLGRDDRIAKIEGKRICLDDIEHALRDLAFVKTAATVVLPGDTPSLAAVVVLSPEGLRYFHDRGAFRLSRALRVMLSEHHEPATLPRRWRFVERMPETALGKPSCALLAALFADDGSTSSDSPPTTARPLLPCVLASRCPQSGSVDLDLLIEGRLAWFQGHFPGAPILPGVVQLDWVVHYGRERLRLPITVARRFRIKFRSPIRPEEPVMLLLRHDDQKARLEFEYRRDGQVCTSGSLELSDCQAAPS